MKNVSGAIIKKEKVEKAEILPEVVVEIVDHTDFYREHLQLVLDMMIADYQLLARKEIGDYITTLEPLMAKL